MDHEQDSPTTPARTECGSKPRADGLYGDGIHDDTAVLNLRGLAWEAARLIGGYERGDSVDADRVRRWREKWLALDPQDGLPGGTYLVTPPVALPADGMGSGASYVTADFVEQGGVVR